MNDSRSVTLRNISIAAGASVLAVVVPAAVLWATDRAELKAATVAVALHSVAIDALRQESSARYERDANLKEQLVRMQTQLDRIADRVGAKP